LEELLILAHQRVAGLGKDLHQRFLVQGIQRGDDRQPADKLGNHPEFNQVIAGHFAEQLAEIVFPLLRIAAEAYSLTADAASNNVFQPDKRTAANEKNVGCVDLDVLLLGMLPPALRGYVTYCAFQHFQERLLNPFATHVPSNTDVLTSLGDLI